LISHNEILIFVLEIEESPLLYENRPGYQEWASQDPEVVSAEQTPRRSRAPLFDSDTHFYQD